MVLLRRSRCRAFSLTLTLALALAIRGLPAAEPAGLESDVKAAFLYNFAKFVEWPPDAFPAPSSPTSPSSPMILCIYGEDRASAGLEASLGALTQGERMGNRPLVVRRLGDLASLRECHVLFIAAAEKGHLPDVLAALREARALTVGEGTDFLDKGGMIRLFLEQNRMRFDINLDAAEKSSLKISSKLLRLAQAVNPQRQQRSQRQED